MRVRIHFVEGQVTEIDCETWMATDQVLRVKLESGVERCFPMRRIQFYDSVPEEARPQ